MNDATKKSAQTIVQDAARQDHEQPGESQQYRHAGDVPSGDVPSDVEPTADPKST